MLEKIITAILQTVLDFLRKIINEPDTIEDKNGNKIVRANFVNRVRAWVHNTPRNRD